MRITPGESNIFAPLIASILLLLLQEPLRRIDTGYPGNRDGKLSVRGRRVEGRPNKSNHYNG